jgi:putative tryptophan/tyrosine transport system substrate-binding protein
MMDRRAFMTMMGGSILSVPFATEAQRAGKMYKVGILNGAAPEGPAEAALREALRTLGYVEGSNLMIEAKAAHGIVERLPTLMRELLDAKPEVIVTFGTTAAQAAKAATTTTPIVMGFAGDPVGTQLVASLARPGGNVTGMSLATSELAGKRLELLKQITPKVTRLTILGDITREVEVQETEKGARVLGMTVALVELTQVIGLEKALAEAARTRPQTIFVINTAVTVTHRAGIIDFALKNRVPLVGTQAGWAKAGALMDYSASLTDATRRAAVYVDKILNGATPGDLPIQRPTKFDLVINKKTAQALRLTIPQTVLLQADQVIE